MLSVIMLNVANNHFMLSVVKLNVAMLSVVVLLESASGIQSYITLKKY
jgi:hypothetical protein